MLPCHLQQLRPSAMLPFIWCLTRWWLILIYRSINADGELPVSPPSTYVPPTSFWSSSAYSGWWRGTYLHDITLWQSNKRSMYLVLVRFSFGATCGDWVFVCILRPIIRAGTRVMPDHFAEHRRTHLFMTPCCLCACNAGGSYIETAVYQLPHGPNSGDFVAGCASGNCGYIGQYYFGLYLVWNLLLNVVHLERLYSANGVFIERYPIRRESFHTVVVILVLILSSNASPWRSTSARRSLFTWRSQTIWVVCCWVVSSG